METNGVERTIWIDTPRERVWRAITDPHELEKWFLPALPGAQLKLDDSGTLLVAMGPMEIGFAMVEGVDPQRRVTTRGLPDQLTAATYTLADQDGGTLVTVRMTGFESMPSNTASDRTAPSGAAWDKALANLKAYVEGNALPYPQGFIAALFGYRKESAAKFAIERSIWIDASRERVWEALTDPEKVERWFSPGTRWVSTGLEVGARLYSPDPETGAERYVQVMDVVEPPHRLVQHSEPPPPGSFQVTSYTLVAEKGGTRLILEHSGYAHLTEEARSNSMEQNAFGFGMMLANIKASVEGKALPNPMGF